MTTAIIGWIAAAFQVSLGVPQIVTVLRARDINGVSVTTWGLYTASGVFWEVYGLLRHDPAIIGTSLFVMASGLLITVIALARRRNAEKQTMKTALATYLDIRDALERAGNASAPTVPRSE